MNTHDRSHPNGFGDEPFFPVAQLAADRGIEVTGQTIRRWVVDGLHGAKLRALRIAGGWQTTKSAFADFLSAAARAEAQRGGGAAPARMADDDADRVLDSFGLGRESTPTRKAGGDQ